jgi:hypothetical protein
MHACNTVLSSLCAGGPCIGGPYSASCRLVCRVVWHGSTKLRLSEARTCVSAVCSERRLAAAPSDAARTCGRSATHASSALGRFAGSGLRQRLMRSATSCGASSGTLRPKAARR